MNTALKYPLFPEEPDSGPPNPPGHKHHWWRIVGWTVLGIFIFLVVAVFLLAAFVNSDGEHTALLRFAQKQATQTLGVPVQLQNVQIHWSPLGIDLYGLKVEGAGPHPNPPLLQVDHIQVGVRIVSLFQAKWYLSNLRIDHPVAWIYVDKNGVSNLPTFKSSGSSGNNDLIFNLGIRHAVLDRGQVYYNSQPSTLYADLHHLDFRAAFSQPQQMYSGRLSYSDGHLKFGAYQPIPHNFDATFSVTPSTFQLNQAKLSSGDSEAVLSATIHNYFTDPAVQAQYRVALDGTQFRQLLHTPTLPAGFLHASGTMHYQKQGNQPLLQAVTLQGDLTSDKLDVSTASAQAVITHLAAHYAVDHGNAALHDLHANLLGGEISAQGSMADLGGNAHSQFKAALHNLSLAQLKQQAGKSGATPGVALGGTLNATATATWGKTMANLVARTDATIQGQVAPSRQSTAAPGAVPVQSELHATYTRSNGQLAVAHSYIRAPQTNLSLNGTVSKSSSLSVQLQANDLHELADIANSFHPPAPGQQPLQLSGNATFKGNVQGSTSAPHISGQLTASNLSINGSDLKLVRTGVDASPNRARLIHAEIQPAGRGRISLNANATLDHWAFSKQSPLQVQLNASQLDVAELVKFTGKQIPVTGTLNTSVNLHGSVMSPQGNGTINLSDLTAYQQPVKSLQVNFSGNGNQAHANLAVNLPSGAVHGNFTVDPKQRTYTAQLTSSGIQLDQLQALQARNLKANGELALQAHGQGSFDNPELQASIESPSITVARQTISALKLQLNVANHVAHAALSSTTLNAPIDAKATVQLTGDYQTEAALNTPVLSLKPILALYSPEQAANITGQAQIQAMLRGPLKNLQQVQAHVTIPVLQMAYQDKVQMAAPTPIQVNYQNGVLDLLPGSIQGTDTNIHFQGHIPTNSTQPMSLQVQGSVDLKLAQLFNPDIVSSGQLKLNIDSHGLLRQGANLGGEIDVVDANFADPDMPVGLQHGNGVLKLTTDRINIDSFEGKVGGGTVSMQGGVQYRPKLMFSLGMAAKDIRMLYPEGMRESVNANIRLNGNANYGVLSGDVGLTDLAFTPAFDLSGFAGQLSGGVEAPPAQGFTQNLRLNLNVHSVNAMNLMSRELSVNGSANLQVRGTAAQPVLLGRINLTSGDIILNGNRFVLTGGTIQFVNPMQTEPVLNLTITTTIQEYKIDMRFRGPVTQMHPEYSSNPALPPADIIHLLAFGSTTEAAANNTVPANQQAESLVASQVSSQVTSRISKVAGISQLSVSPVLQGGSSQGPAGADITIRQRITGKLFVTFSTNVATTQNEIIQGQYQLSPRVAISATRDENGGFGFDTLIKKTW